MTRNLAETTPDQTPPSGVHTGRELMTAADEVFLRSVSIEPDREHTDEAHTAPEGLALSSLGSERKRRIGRVAANAYGRIKGAVNNWLETETSADPDGPVMNPDYYLRQQPQEASANTLAPIQEYVQGWRPRPEGRHSRDNPARGHHVLGPTKQRVGRHVKRDITQAPRHQKSREPIKHAL